MVQSAFSAPHVTEWLTVDVTRTMDMVKRLKADREWQGVRLTPLVFVARAFLLAIRRFPDINVSWDEQAQEIVHKHYVNLGIAAATPRGLIVPNIKDCHEFDVTGLAHAIDTLVQTARSGKTPPEDMSRGTITITNIGALGVDAGTPILNPGEAAILALGAVRDTPWVVDGQIVPRKTTQLAMSFDHRLVDGAVGSQVLAEVGRLLSDPGETFLFV
ncbi:2-oxo acid dehydrogenase subunit E2 [Aeromicrobium sp. UC242_57]|uniref:2-oxo acid dehydrogenase subunit E2 n=1 Tax=Aeromicrobium sp. UC242_57 TaxID=3374624 RepID=UPI0037927BB3